MWAQGPSGPDLRLWEDKEDRPWIKTQKQKLKQQGWGKTKVGERNNII